MLTELEETEYSTSNTQSIGLLWHHILKYYGVEFYLSEHIICLRSSGLISRAEKKWKSKRVAIEGRTEISR